MSSKRCPYCAEEIRAEAVRCPHCRSRVEGFEVTGWHRDHPQALLAGVASGLANALSVPLVLVRVAFVALGLVHLLGVLVYLALWALMPHTSGAESPLEDFLRRAQGWARRMSGRDEEHSGSKTVELDNGVS